MRATQLQEAFNWVEALDPLPRQAILERCVREHVAEVTEAHRLAWIPLEYGVELTEAVHQVLGDEGLRAFGRDSAFSSRDRVWMRPILEAALHIFGSTPRGIFRFAPRVWDAVFRNAGDLSFVERGPHEGTLLLTNFPPLVSTRSHLVAISGSFSAALNFCRVRGDVILLPLTKGASTVAFDVTWEATKSVGVQLR